MDDTLGSYVERREICGYEPQEVRRSRDSRRYTSLECRSTVIILNLVSRVGSSILNSRITFDRFSAHDVSHGERERGHLCEGYLVHLYKMQERTGLRMGRRYGCPLAEVHVIHEWTFERE